MRKLGLTFFIVLAEIICIFLNKKEESYQIINNGRISRDHRKEKMKKLALRRFCLLFEKTYMRISSPNT